MAQTFTKISALTAATTLVDADLIAGYVLSGGNFTAKKITFANFKTALAIPPAAGSTSITTLGTITTGTLGTGAIIGGVTMTIGSDATGDIYYRNAGGILTRRGIGSADQVLTVVAGVPTWADAGGGGSIYTPEWEWTSAALGVPAEGCFTTDNASYGNTSQIRMSRMDGNGASDWYNGFFSTGSAILQIPCLMLMTGANGHVSVFTIISTSDDGEPAGNALLSVVPRVYNGGGVWLAQDYYVTFAPTPSF